MHIQSWFYRFQDNVQETQKKNLQDVKQIYQKNIKIKNPNLM